MANCRRQAFDGLSDHAWHGRFLKRLSAADLKIARDFIAANTEATPGEFEHRLNRMFLDRPKPKNWTLILQLLQAAKTLAS